MALTPELQDLFSLRNLVLYGGALLMTLIVSVARVARERGVQRREGKPLTTFGEGVADAVYGSLAGIAWLLLQDSVKPLPIKAALGLAMFFGSIGPTTWDLVSALMRGQYTLTKKEDT